MAPSLYDKALQFRAACEGVRAAGGTLGLVPTMGALHRGHIALMHAAKRLASHVAVTLFVNPTQFSAGEDYGKYPRALERDKQLCEAAGVDLLFVPGVDEMYPDGECTRVRVSGLTEVLCGAVRPGHFEGVATVVAKLFGLAGTCTAVFGKKDYQQLKVIESMTRDLMLAVKVVGHPTVREPDGLAMSSRNAYLSPNERKRACAIVKGLSGAHRAFCNGERRSAVLLDGVRSSIAVDDLTLQYAELADPESLQLWSNSSELPARARALLAIAACCGTTRLIDNLVLGEDPDPLSESPPGKRDYVTGCENSR
jgi:pantoate--beta-alanine ligase